MAVIVACGILLNIAPQNQDADPPEEENSQFEEASKSFVEFDEYMSEMQGGQVCHSLFGINNIIINVAF